MLIYSHNWFLESHDFAGTTLGTLYAVWGSSLLLNLKIFGGNEQKWLKRFIHSGKINIYACIYIYLHIYIYIWKVEHDDERIKYKIPHPSVHLEKRMIKEIEADIINNNMIHFLKTKNRYYQTSQTNVFPTIKFIHIMLDLIASIV